MRETLYFILCMFFFVSCNETKRPDFIINGGYNENDNSQTESISYQYQDVEMAVPVRYEDIEIKFTERSNVRYIGARINGTGVHDMIFDTGCSGTLISLGEARHLFDMGVLSSDDFTGVEYAVVANGNIVENMGVILKSVELDGKLTFKDVKATISKSVNAPLLIGNEIINRAKSCSIDNTRNVIKFTVEAQ